MQHFIYISALLVSLGGLLFLDLRYKVAIGKNRRAALKTIGSAVALFLLWDIIAISLGVFKRGFSDYSLPFTILPELPLEEVLFLALLCYCALLAYVEVPRWRRTR